MPGLASANHRIKVIAALRRGGFNVDEGGKHTVMHHPDGRYTTIPRHKRINPILLKKIVKQCGLTEQAYLKLYR